MKLKDMLDLKGKTALITGGAGILGPMHAEALAEYGADVVIADINLEKAEQIAKRISEEFGTKAIAVHLDLADESSIKDMVSNAIDAFGKVDILINNAQGSSPNEFELFESFPKKDWDQIIGINLGGMFLCTREVAKHMLKHGNGNIINISSIYGVVAPDQRIYEGSMYKGRQINSPAVYSASKGGVIAFTKYLAAYYEGKNIRVNCISPGGVENGQNDKFIKNYSRRVPLGRMAKRHELKGAIVFLASEASSYVNGHNLIVDGGLSAW